MIAGMVITAAEPSGVWGLLQEAMTGGWALVEARSDAQANALVRSVAEDFATAEGRAAAPRIRRLAARSKNCLSSEAPLVPRFREASVKLTHAAP